MRGPVMAKRNADNSGGRVIDRENYRETISGLFLRALCLHMDGRSILCAFKSVQFIRNLKSRRYSFHDGVRCIGDIHLKRAVRRMAAAAAAG